MDCVGPVFYVGVGMKDIQANISAIHICVTPIVPAGVPHIDQQFKVIKEAEWKKEKELRYDIR